jgi:hypothetical protein
MTDASSAKKTSLLLSTGEDGDQLTCVKNAKKTLDANLECAMLTAVHNAKKDTLWSEPRVWAVNLRWKVALTVLILALVSSVDLRSLMWTQLKEVVNAMDKVSTWMQILSLKVALVIMDTLLRNKDAKSAMS